MKLLFRQVQAEGGCNSFIVADERSGKACIVDPRADLQSLYEEFLAARGLAATVVLDTHTHADHYSGSHLVAQRLGARVAMSQATASGRAEIRLSDGQVLEIGGGLALRALATPGHTPDSMSFVLEGSWGRLALTGDTLFIGGSGRVDFPGADPEAQYESLHHKLGALAADTWMMPGHDYAGLLFSTLGHERRTNPHLVLKSREEFVAAKRAELLEAPALIDQVLKYNLEPKPRSTPRCGAVTACASFAAAAGAPVARETPAALKELLQAHRNDGTLFVDVREPEEFTSGRIEGFVNIPLSELFLHWRELLSAPHVHFACLQGLRSAVAVNTARRLGLENVSDLAGGTLAWLASGNKLRRSD